MAASISAGTIREPLAQQLEGLLRSGQYEELHALLESQLISHPDDRELHLYQLFCVTKTEGVAGHEKEIEGLRNLTAISDREREVIRRIFILGFEEAQREGIKEKAWAYQRLARRLVLRQSLLGPLPRVESSDALESERGKQATDDSSESSSRLSTGRIGHAWGFVGQRNLLVSSLLVVGGLGLAAVLAKYAPTLWNQSRLELPAQEDPSNEIAATELVEYHAAGTQEEDPKAVPLAHDEAKVKGATKDKNISATAAGIRAGEVKVTKASVSHPREKPAKDVPADHPRDEAKEGALGTYQVRVDVGLREEPRFGSPRGATIKKGTLIRGVGLSRDWLRIRVPSDGTTGFIRKEFVVPVSSAEPR